MSRLTNLWELAAARWRSLFVVPAADHDDDDQIDASRLRPATTDDQDDDDALRYAISRQHSRE